MAIFTDQAKNTSAVSNQSFGGSGLTWNQDNNTWDQSSSATWNDPTEVWASTTKHSSSMTDQAKN